MKVLVTDWFSFKDMGGSAGDLLARDLASDWLHEAACNYEMVTLRKSPEGCDK